MHGSRAVSGLQLAHDSRRQELQSFIKVRVDLW